MIFGSPESSCIYKSLNNTVTNMSQVVCNLPRTPCLVTMQTLESVPMTDHVSQVQVCDNHNGTYSLAYNLPLEGQWVLHPTVDGVAVKQHGLMVQAKYGPLQAADISFTLHHAQDAACCGGCCRVQIQVSHYNKLQVGI